MRRMKGLDIPRGKAGNRFLSPVCRLAVRGTREKEHGEDGVGQILGIVADKFQGRKGLLTLALNFGGRKGGMEDHVRKQVESKLGVLGENCKGGKRTVPLRVGLGCRR